MTQILVSQTKIMGYKIPILALDTVIQVAMAHVPISFIQIPVSGTRILDGETDRLCFLWGCFTAPLNYFTKQTTQAGLGYL